jgi:hypothetical protein
MWPSAEAGKVRFRAFRHGMIKLGGERNSGIGPTEGRCAPKTYRCGPTACCPTEAATRNVAARVRRNGGREKPKPRNTVPGSEFSL